MVFYVIIAQRLSGLGGIMLTRNLIFGLVTLGVLLVMMLYIAMNPLPFR
jgi:hypothetical protein